jgi:hypothetical protein
MMKSVERGEIQVHAEVPGVEKQIHHQQRYLTLICILLSVLILGLALYFVGSRLGY